MEAIKMDGVKEYAEGMIVELTQTTGIYESAIPKEQRDGYGRWVIRAKNEGGYNCTEVDVFQLVQWLKSNRPDMIA
jgi:hypothetical protein